MFFWPYALKKGWRYIYLGSPMPGLQDWLNNNEGRSAMEYACLYKCHAPLDQQLRYYQRRGFRQLVAIKKNYFPHQSSLNYGAILRGHIPLMQFNALWKYLPLSILGMMRSLVFRLV
jgi:hypothetical protein